ncbi:phosphotransferase [Streptomyces sp. NPDC006529]|uniref:phosphotransferase n=1 Tax=Streptomyces sp. NPDC006529 TaxID=3157177 RepID=UPI0033B534C2
MKQTAKTLPAPLLRWAEERIGAVAAVRDASHDWDRSRVWELEGTGGVSWYLKVSPSEKFYLRESRAYRHVVPALGHTRAPQLVDCQARGDAEASLDAAADGAEKYLARARDRLTEDEWQLIRDHAARLRRVGPVPVGHIHGDNQPRNWMVFEGVLALIDFERARPAACVQDFIILTATQWADHPDREKAFFRGYGRSLTDAERQALRCLTVLDAVNCLAWGPDNGDELVTARVRRTLDRLMREERP